MKTRWNGVRRAGAPPAVIGIRRVASVALALQLLFAVSAHGILGGNTNHIYGANIGWIFTGIGGGNGPVIGEFYCTGSVYSANCGWISFGNPGGPANGYAYSNLGTDYGVNNIGGGQLSGMAYGANIGWITFEQTYGQPRVDLHTGILSGYAYSANCGWMSFNSVIADMKITSLSPGPLDGNGLPIAWEKDYFGTTNINANADPDGDGMSNLQEYLAGTNPTDPNSRLRITAVGANTIGSSATLTWTSVPSRLYCVEERTNLTTGAWATNLTLGVVSPDVGSTTTRGLIESAVTNRFFRVQAIVPLSP
jgi:Bacterial TSP3 repeat